MSYANLGLSGPTYEQTQALAKAMTPAERAAKLAAGLAALPRCYGAETSNCLKERTGEPRTPGCDAISAAYIANWDEMEKAVQELPYCHENSVAPRTAAMIGGGALVGGLLLGRGSLLSAALGAGAGYLAARMLRV
jgi:hypothetical protein